MDIPETPASGPEGPVDPTAENPATPGDRLSAGAEEPTAPISVPPPDRAPGWPPPPYGPPPPPSAGPGGAAWGPIATPYGLAWGPPPVPPVSTPPRRSRGILFAVTALAVALSTLVGLAVGYAVWRPTALSSNDGGSNSLGNPFNGGSSNGGSSNGGSSNGGSFSAPFGNGSAGSGSSSSTTGVASKVDPGLVDINVVLSYANESAAGTGQVLTSSGEVLTNNHVIDGATSISATDVGNGRTYTARVVGYDRSADLAVLQLEGASGLSTVSIGDSSRATVGEAVVAIGNAGGAGGTPSAAAGSITNLDQSITASDDNGANAEQLTGLIEVNANVQPGDSGGPLVDGSGNVIGVDTAASTNFNFSASSGDGYAIPINEAKNIARQIEAGRSSSTVHIGETALLGVVVQPVNSGFGNGLGSGGNGAAVIQVEPNTPAEQAGIVAGDVITSLGGQSIGSPSDLSAAISSHEPGDSVQLGWVDSNGNQHTATVKLAGGAPPD
jgi:S1-C subfamily serine protease